MSIIIIFIHNYVILSNYSYLISYLFAHSNMVSSFK